MLDDSTRQCVQIHAHAPAKPAIGLPCNGCGLCCAAEPCPVSRLWLGHTTGACRALQWSNVNKRYQCAMVTQPAAQLWWLPKVFNTIFGRWVHRWIAAGVGCDFDAEVSD
jgi:hypothetical protein